jgi:ATP-dependent RNA helicase DDX49/DBP8
MSTLFGKKRKGAAAGAEASSKTETLKKMRANGINDGEDGGVIKSRDRSLQSGSAVSSKGKNEEELNSYHPEGASALTVELQRSMTSKEDGHTIEDDGEDVDQPLVASAVAVPTTTTSPSSSTTTLPSYDDFEEMMLAEPLVETCKALGYRKPTPVQQTIIPFLLRNQTDHVLALAATGTGKTAAFVLPILHHLSMDPYGIFAVIVSPTRELAAQIYQQVLALGSQYSVRSCLVIGGVDSTKQATQLDQKPHIVVATPGRLAELLRGPSPPHLANVRYLVLDEADRLLSTENTSGGNGFERDVAELVLHCNRAQGGGRRLREERHRPSCQTLLFSATMTKSLESLQEIASGLGGGSSHSLKKFVIGNNKKKDVKKIGSARTITEETLEDGALHDDDMTYAESTLPALPAGLRQEYVFMPSRVRDAYLLAVIRTLVATTNTSKNERLSDYHQKKTQRRNNASDYDNDTEAENDGGKARSAIVFVSTCQRCALVSEVLSQVGVNNVALHSLLSQNRRLAALAKFKSHHVRVCVATDLASRGLDIPTVDLVINAELPRNPISYVHRIGRTARAGRRGRAINLVSENDVSLVHAAESTTGKKMDKCTDVTDATAIQMLGSVTKAARLAKMKLSDIGFDELVKKNKERKVAEKKERRRIEKSLKKQQKQASIKKSKVSQEN